MNKPKECKKLVFYEDMKRIFSLIRISYDSPLKSRIHREMETAASGDFTIRNKQTWNS